jgi:hypothetical protein
MSFVYLFHLLLGIRVGGCVRMIKHGQSTICLLYIVPAGIRAYVEYLVVIWAGIIFGASGGLFVEERIFLS